MKFKVGDRVRVVGGDYSITVLGTEGIITYINEGFCRFNILKHREFRMVGEVVPVSLNHLEKIDNSKHSRKRHLLDAIQVED